MIYSILKLKSSIIRNKWDLARFDCFHKIDSLLICLTVSVLKRSYLLQYNFLGPKTDLLLLKMTRSMSMKQSNTWSKITGNWKFGRTTWETPNGLFWKNGLMEGGCLFLANAQPSRLPMKQSLGPMNRCFNNSKGFWVFLTDLQ